METPEPNVSRTPEGKQEAEREANYLSKETNQKHCRECFAVMPIQANKCISCGSIQNYKRFLTLSSSVLALLVALTSVISFAIPIWHDRFHRPKPVPLVAVVDDAPGTGLSVTISNSGDAPMSLGAMTFSIGDGGGDDLQFPLEAGSSLIVIQENKIIPANLGFPYNTIVQPLQALSNRLNNKWYLSRIGLKCRVDFAFFDATGEKISRSIETKQDDCSQEAAILMQKWCDKVHESSVCTVPADSELSKAIVKRWGKVG